MPEPRLVLPEGRSEAVETGSREALRDIRRRLACAAATESGPGPDVAFAGGGVEAIAENSAGASGPGDCADRGSGDASRPALDNALERSGSLPDAAAGSGRTRSITVVSSAGAERMGATSRMTAPVRQRVPSQRPRR